MKQNKKIILLVNLGSIDSLTTKSIKSFLKCFLLDKRVVNLPKFFWYPLLNFIILPLRSRRLLGSYKKIWINGNSPLKHHTINQTNKLKKMFDNESIVVEYAFSYSEPLLCNVLKSLSNKYNISDLTIIPLYPQFSTSTTSSVFDILYKFYQNKGVIPNIKFISSFYKHEMFINAIVNKIKKFWNTNKNNSEFLVFSYHGLPVKMIESGDVYYTHCIETTKLIVDKLNLPNLNYKVCFQSKFGTNKWIGPSTIDTLRQLAKQNVKSVDIICPGFVSDCLETLEEICILNKDAFIENGGINYRYIECLNDNDDFISFLCYLINY